MPEIKPKDIPHLWLYDYIWKIGNTMSDSVHPSSMIGMASV